MLPSWNRTSPSTLSIAEPWRRRRFRDYALEREFEDVVAVVHAVAGECGALVNLYGHSHGGLVAFGAAALTSNIRRLVLYQGWHVSNPDVLALPEGLKLRMDTISEAGDRDAVVELLFRRA